MVKRQSQVNEAGFTIIEVLVAMVLFAVMMAGLAAMQVTIFQSTTNSRLTAMAIAVGQSRLEEFRTQPYAGITTASRAANGCFDFDGNTATCSSSSDFFQRYITIADSGTSLCGTTTITGKQILIEMEWKNRAGGTENRKLCLERMP